MENRQRIAELFGELENEYGLRLDDIRNAIGQQEATFDRVRQELGCTGDTESVTRFLNATLLQKLEGLKNAIKRALYHDKLSHCYSVQNYVSSVEAQFQRFRNGEKHVLVSVLPPLECEKTEVSSAVILAALRGVRFEYHFLSEDTIRTAFPGLKRPFRSASARIRLSVAEDHYALWDGRFMKIPPGRSIATILQHKFEIRLAEMRGSNVDSGKAPATRLEANALRELSEREAMHKLRDQITFHELNWVPVMFNEKLAWSTNPDRDGINDRPRHQVIHKEIVWPDSRHSESTIYSDDTKWVRVRQQVPDDIVQMLVSGQGATAIGWPDETAKRTRRAAR